MSLPFGQTRTRIATRHALIAPDGHVKSNVPGITGATTTVLISEAMGAKFTQLLVTFEGGGSATFPGNEIETVGYLETGGGMVEIGGDGKKRIAAGGYFFAPAGTASTLAAAKAGTRLTLFQKKFVPLAGAK